MELTKELFIELTGEDPSQYKGVKRIWQNPHYPSREFPVQHTAESLVRRVEVDDPNLFEDGILTTKRGRANYTFSILGNMMMCTLTFSGSNTSITYYFEKDEQAQEVIPAFILEQVEQGVYRIVSGSTINGVPVDQVPEASEVCRLGGGIEFDSDLNAPVLTHSSSVRMGETFTTDWSKDADKYLPFEHPFVITCEVKLDDGNLRWYYDSSLLVDDRLEKVETPRHHKIGDRLVVRPSNWK